MAKLNYDRDVKCIVKDVKTASGWDIVVRNPSDKWVLYIDGTAILAGNLREVYCYLLGMKKVYDNV